MGSLTWLETNLNVLPPPARRTGSTPLVCTALPHRRQHFRHIVVNRRSVVMTTLQRIETEKCYPSGWPREKVKKYVARVDLQMKSRKQGRTKLQLTA